MSTEKPTVSLRWIMIHMIEEYARHNGHADLLREQIDGAVGSEHGRSRGPCRPDDPGHRDDVAVKFSFRQILASVGGAVIAAIIASAFGVKGTIVGVAIGSAAATMGTALVAQSIERGQKAVKQVVVRAPDASPLLRKLGATGSSGGTASSVDASSAPTEAVAETGAAPETGEMAIGRHGRRDRAPGDLRRGRRPGDRAAAGHDDTDAAGGARTPERVHSGSPGRAIAGTAAIVFVLALLLIVAIELISGKPLVGRSSATRARDLAG